MRGMYCRVMPAVVALIIAGCGSDTSTTDSVVPDTKDEVSLDVLIPEVARPADMGQEEVALPPPDYLWPAGGHPFDWPQFAKDREWLKNVSSWSFGVDQGEQVPPFRYLPDFGLGNGYVFSLLGYTNPLHTLHSMSGPIYEKGEGFFSDSWLEVHSGPDGAPLQWQRQWVGRVRRTDIVHTQAIGPSIAVFTVDVAPRGIDDQAGKRALVRLVLVRNRSATKLNDIWLSVRFARDQTPDGQGVSETRNDRMRWTVAVGEGDGVQTGEDGLHIPLGSIDAKSERLVKLAYVVDDPAQQRQATLAALEAIEPDNLLESTRDWWHARLDASTVVTTPDERVNDWLEFSKVMLLSQTAATGASSAMCEYTGTWLRDNAGPARFLMTCGLHEEVRGMLDYLWLAALAAGNVKNSNFAGYEPEDAQPQPDWASMPVQKGRERAESPSYVPLMYSWYWKGSGKLDFLPQRLEMLRYCLDKQDFKDDLLPFSTDETFRTAMAVAHGLSLVEQFEDGYVSSNSSFLWVAAAQALAAMVEKAGIMDVAPEYLSRAAQVRQVAESTFKTEDGWYLPYVHEQNGPAPAPFEDVNTKPIWTGYLPPDDDGALDNLGQTVAVIGGEDGLLISPLAQSLAGMLNVPIEEGVYTGMSPGYFLQNLAAASHPLAQSAFNRLSDHLQDGGTIAEYQVLDDFSPLHAVYDELGPVGDYTARFRPWEGGILADAAFAYLLGNRADAPESSLALAPNLPNGWSWLEATGIRVGDSRIDLRVQSVDGVTTVKATLTSGTQTTLTLTLPLASSATKSAAIDGAPAQPEVRSTRWDTWLATFPAVTLAPGKEVLFKLEM